MGLVGADVIGVVPAALTLLAALDPDPQLLPSEATINSAGLLQAPLDPAVEQLSLIHI